MVATVTLQTAARAEPIVPAAAGMCENAEMGAVGREHVAEVPQKPQVFGTGGAESGAHGCEITPELAEVVNAWPSLPANVRAGIVATVRAAGKGATR